MAGKRRSIVQRERDLNQLANLFVRGATQQDVANKLGVSQQQVSYDLKALRKQWLENTTLKLDEHKAQELIKIGEIEKEYWEGWTQSLKESKTKTSIMLKDENGENLPIKEIVKTERSCGDPRYLQGIQWCIERRCKLLGLDAPLKISGDRNNPIVIEHQYNIMREQLSTNPALLESLEKIFASIDRGNNDIKLIDRNNNKI